MEINRIIDFFYKLNYQNFLIVQRQINQTQVKNKIVELIKFKLLKKKNKNLFFSKYP